MLIAEFRVSTPLLQTAIERTPGVTISVEEQYVTNEGIRMLFWASGDGSVDLQAALEADPTVTNPKRIAGTPTRDMYRVRITDHGEANTTYRLWSEFNIVSLEATITDEGWIGRFRFPDRDALARYRGALQDRELDFHLRALYRETDAKTADGVRENRTTSVLTTGQHEALVTAYEAGYFDVPRGASQPDVATELGIASQSLSERLRRGTKTLVETTLIED